MRDISDILLFRGDISPFLAHLTRNLNGVDAKSRLEKILNDKQLLPGPSLVSDARFGGNTLDMDPDQKKLFFGAVCFTETPVSEAHCLLEIGGRTVNLEPYGLVFIKDKLKSRGVSPVIYLNNEMGNVDAAVYALFSLKDTDPEGAEKILPLVAVFGQKVQPPNAPPQTGNVDFTWEREWRYPTVLGPFEFTFNDVFCGLCPHNEIYSFESRYAPLKFIDPRRNMKWYAQSLIDSRQRLDLKYSVV